MQPLARVPLARTRPAWRAWLGLLLVLAPVVGYFHLAATVSVEVPPKRSRRRVPPVLGWLPAAPLALISPQAFPGVPEPLICGSPAADKWR